MNIKILDAHLASQIAAGEVVERPSSVVKELLENSLDAGATEINLEIEHGGIKLISLRDNGLGIAKDELRLALSRHATSKIHNLDDLEQIRTLGFRGEALASVCSVARFKLISKIAAEAAGWQIVAEGETQELSLEPCSHPTGTTVEVRDLFFNVPVRRKFLRTEQTEFNHILELVGRLALSRFDVEFLFKHNGKIIWSLPLAKNPQECIERVGEIVGKEFTQHAYAIDVGSDALKLTGWIAEPGYTRNQPDLQYLYVNGRIVRDKTIAHAIRQAYQDVVYAQRYPVVVLYLNLDPSLVDVNVHPTKAEVRFRDSRLIHDFVAHGLKEALAAMNGACIAALPKEKDSMPYEASEVQDGKKSWINNFRQQSLVLTAAEESGAYSKNKLALETAGAHTNIKDQAKSAVSASYENFSFSPSPATASINENLIPPLGFALALLHGTYILAENQEGLIVVDAHAAHERINYEKLKTEYNSQAVQSQTILIPITVTLNDREINCIEANGELLTKLGFTITRSSPDSVLVRSIPVLLQGADIEQLVRDFLADLLTYDSPDSMIENSNKILASVACHSSVRANQKLSIDEMNELLRTLEKTTNGNQCGHGRPTWMPLTLTSLAKLFLRW